jgi:DNA-binding GntR family transcriptional regulator
MTANLKIDVPKSLTEMVIARLEQAIVDGEFGLGEPISEITLATSFGVSRTPVRDALAALQRGGLVTILNKKGSYVFKPTAEDAAALCEYRLVLETKGIQLSHERAKPEALKAMRESLALMEAVMTGNAVAYGRADTRFHQTFLEFCGNSYLVEAYQLAGAKVAALRTHLTAHMVERRVESFKEHLAMIECFAAGDLDRMTAVLTRHIDRTSHIYVEALSPSDRGGRASEPSIQRVSP